MLLQVSIGVLTFIFLVYRFLVSAYGYWKSRGFPYLEGSFPFGTDKEASTQGRYLGYVYDDMYKRLDPHPYGGFYNMRRPLLLVRDPEVIKHVLLKDFQYFRDRSRLLACEQEPLSKHLAATNGDKWRALRIKMTPTFSSGKLKNMFPLFEACSRQLEEVLAGLAEGGEVLDLKDLMTSFTSDIIASCAFGLEVNSLKNSDSEFKRMGADAFPKFTKWQELLRYLLNNLFPGFYRYIDFPHQYSKSTRDFMMKVVRETVEYREKNGCKRNDFLDLLIEMKNEDANNINAAKKSGNTNVEMTLEMMVAQCFLFSVAGLETSSSVATFCLYELAINSEIQEKLRREIREVKNKHGGITYQAIQELAYLDQVVSETIRKYPTVVFLQRTCTKPYRMPHGGQLLDEGIELIIPVYSLHHDPKYFPDPETFDPGRFSPERKSSIPQFAYLPFGEGPRNCIGLRFGMLQVKMGICCFLTKYRISTTCDSSVPLRMARSPLFSIAKDPVKVQIKEIQ